MNTFIILVVCLIIVTYLLRKLLRFINILSHVQFEFEQYQQLRHQYSNERLLSLYKDTRQAIRRVEYMISYDKAHIKNETEEKEILYWQKDYEKDQKLLFEFQKILAEVKREIKARAYFNAQR